MKLMLRPEWRLWPINNFLGLLDLKTAVTIALLFALFNKVAGVYGLISVLTGAGGSFAQLSLYLYSLIGLVAITWGLGAVKEENSRHTLYFAHFFFLDHVLSTIWTLFFAVAWWVYTPHDGRRQANSPAQEAIREGAGVNHTMTDTQLAYAANVLWHEEKGTAAVVIVLSWFAKIYFALLLYSYANHLRKGSYNAIRHVRMHSSAAYQPAYTEDDEDNGDFQIPSLSASHSDSSSSYVSDFVNGSARNGPLPTRHGRGSLGKIIIPVQGNGEVLFETNGR